MTGDALSRLTDRPLAEHIDLLMRRIRSQPQDASLRLALCHFLAAQGQWQRAEEQLNHAVRMDPSFAQVGSTCAIALRGERKREAFLAGEEAPTVLGEQAPWIDELLNAARQVAPTQAEDAAVSRAQARDASPALTGRITSVEVAPSSGSMLVDEERVEQQAFEWLCDGDARLGCVLEVFLPAGYAWLPLTQVRSIKFKRPGHLVDLLWPGATVELVDGRGAAVMVPSRYPGISGEGDDALVLARRTEWLALSGDDQYAGIGQRVFISDLGEHSLLNVRHIEFDSPAPGVGAST